MTSENDDHWGLDRGAVKATLHGKREVVIRVPVLRTRQANRLTWTTLGA